MTSHTQPPAGDDLVARLREGVAYLGNIEGDVETYDIDSANELMRKAAEALTSQLPAGGDLVARLREIADRKRIVSLPPDAEDGLRAAIEALTTPQPPAGDDLVARLREKASPLSQRQAEYVEHLQVSPCDGEALDAAEVMLEAAARIEALTSQQQKPTKVYVAVNHTGCIYECEDEDRVIRAAQSAFETAVARGQQHTEPVAGEVEVVAYRCRHDRPFGGTWQVHQRIYEWDKFDITEPLVRKSSYDALAAANVELQAALDSDPDGSGLWRFWSRKAVEVSQKLTDLIDRAEAAERQRDALREALDGPTPNRGDLAAGWEIMTLNKNGGYGVSWVTDLAALPEEIDRVLERDGALIWSIMPVGVLRARAALKDEGSAT